MKEQKHVQISAELFGLMVKYFLLDDQTCAERIRTLLEEKMDRLHQHQLYTEYRTSDSSDKKEEARQEYLDRKGVPATFRW